MKTIVLTSALLALSFCFCKKETPAPATSPGHHQAAPAQDPATRLPEYWFSITYPETKSLFPLKPAGNGC